MTDQLTTALAVARWAGSAQWLSLRLAESMGAWLPTVDDSTARLMLGRHCGIFGAHASQWFARIPTRRDVDIEAVDAPASGEVKKVLEIVAALTTDPSRMTAIYDVIIPALTRDIDAALTVLRADIDGPSVRLCTLVRADLEAMRNDALGSCAALCNDADTHKRLATSLPTSLLA